MPDPLISARRTLMHPGPAIAGLAGATATLGPYAYAFGAAVGALDEPGWAPQPWTLLAGSMAISIGGLTTRADRDWDQAVLTAGIAGVLVSLAPALLDRPSLALVVLLLAAWITLDAWFSDSPLLLRARALIPTRAELAGTAARAAALTAVVAAAGLSVGFGGVEPVHLLPGLCLAAGFLARWAWLVRGERRGWAAAAVALAAFALVAFWLLGAVAAHVTLAAATFAIIRANRPRPSGASAALLQQHPAGPLVTSFALLCAVGSVLLFAPWASTIEEA